MTAEQIFLRYSFPCAHKLVEMGSITKEQFSELEKATLENKSLDRSKLMMLFPAAFRRLAEVAGKLHRDIWDEGLIRDYFINYHNEYIDERDGNYKYFGETFCNFCKVHQGEVMEKIDSFLKVKVPGGNMDVLSDLLPDADVGDRITIHQGYAIEKLD